MSKVISDSLDSCLIGFYDDCLKLVAGPSLIDKIMGKPIGYKDVKYPKYLHIYLPTISKHFDTDYDGEYSDFDGYLLSLKKVKLFRIGTEIIKEPIYKKQTGKKITFKRYGDIK